MIQPYDCSKWERVYCAFLDFLSNRLAYSRQHKALADNRIRERETEIAKYTAEYRSLNPHLLGSGAYTHTGIRLLNGAARPDKVVSLSHHANGVPIQWRDSVPHPQTTEDKLYLAQLKLAA